MDYKLNDKQLKGVDMVIRAICKKYKFIKGWELFPRHEDYESVLFIHVIMDYQEFADTYKYYTRPSRWSKRSAYTPATYMGRDEEDFDSGYSERDKTIYDEIKVIKEDIELTMKELYERIPDEFVSHFSTKEYPDKLHARSIMITEYIDTHEPTEQLT